MVADSSAENTPNAPEFVCPICLPKTKSSGLQWEKASLGIRGSDKSGKIQAQFMHWVQLMQVNVSENTIPLAYDMSSGRQK